MLAPKWKGYEVARNIILDPEEWSVDNDMMTPSMKVKLRNLLSITKQSTPLNYSKAVNALAVLALALSTAFCVLQFLFEPSVQFIAGAALQTPRPKIAPADSDNHIGIPRK